MPDMQATVKVHRCGSRTSKATRLLGLYGEALRRANHGSPLPPKAHRGLRAACRKHVQETQEFSQSEIDDPPREGSRLLARLPMPSMWAPEMVKASTTQECPRLERG